MRVLITGGAGFIGSHTVREFVRRKHEVVVLHSYRAAYASPLWPSFASDRNYRFSNLMTGADIRRGDTLNKGHLRALIEDFQPECILHLASLPLVSIATHHPEEAREGIFEGTANVLEIVLKSPSVRRFVYISSSMVYGDFVSSPVDEQAPTNPINVYGGLKLAGEILTRSYLATSNTEHVIVRPSGVYGPTDGNRRVVQIFCENALRGRPIEIIDGPDTIIDFTYVKDVAQGIYLAGTKPNAANQTFNITYGKGRDLTEVADAIRTHVPEVIVRHVSASETDRPRRGTLDISKARELIDYNPRWRLEDGVTRYLNFLKQSSAEEIKVGHATARAS
jgi:UDP-glucose 4-epimerase